MMMSNKDVYVSQEDLMLQRSYMQQVLEMQKEASSTCKKKVCVQTYGCQQNEADSEKLLGMANCMGYEKTIEPSEADLILVNTCAIREHAELKVLSITGQFKHIKEKNPNLLIGICGCMVTQEHRKEDIKHKYPYVDFLFGTDMLYRFPEILFLAMTRKKRSFYIGNSDGNIAEDLPVTRENRYKAWVSIMYGCNNFCSYCVVPYVRGRERSRKKADILKEIKALISEGYSEITLLGQNVNSYGKGREDGDFASLLEEICQIEGDFIVRFMTSHPKDVSDDLIRVMANNPKMARHFHLPLQSGSNRILKEMNRKYTREEYFLVVQKLRKAIPNLAITTDIIVGFPGESEEDFEDTLDMLRQIGYDGLYSFIYSPRKGTTAAVMENQISAEDKNRRFSKLLTVQNEIAKGKNDKYVGRIVRVLCEGTSKEDPLMLTGRTDTNKIVHFKGSATLEGKFILVKITKAETFNLFGEMVDQRDE